MEQRCGNCQHLGVVQWTKRTKAYACLWFEHVVTPIWFEERGASVTSPDSGSKCRAWVERVESKPAGSSEGGR